MTKPLTFFNDHIFVRDSGDYGIIDTNGSVTLSFRPFIEEVQARAAKFGVEFLVPQTEEAIRARNAQPSFPS
ncbi:hypothetical protein [Paenibacillus rhizovicinus]|uniref:hypothetical protein n=1 Tax=Paenibacillus rhizovicinus TaxID=2704463 RepID=UPI001CDCDC0D|nr:hypothetical protein [Paenibacillus rhizovicinus]